MSRTKAFNKEEVLERAMKTFWDKGYHATSMDDLVESMGINRSSIYNTFGDKKKLFNKALDRYSKQIYENLYKHLTSKDNIQQTFKNLLRNQAKSVVNNTTSRGCFVLNSSLEMLPYNDDVRTIVVANRTAMISAFHDAMKLGVERGQIGKDKDIKALALLFYTLFNGIRAVGANNATEKEQLASVNEALTLLD